jgi:hypothetical protein
VQFAFQLVLLTLFHRFGFLFLRLLEFSSAPMAEHV